MNTVSLYTKASMQCSRNVTQIYSTSFSSAVSLLHPELQPHIHAIYGFVRLADEIVDTFHGHQKEVLLKEFKQGTSDAIERGISLNPILHSFQETVAKYNIERRLIQTFLCSMEMDLHKKNYLQASELEEYIYGSAEVVGLMCLYVFCEGDKEKYRQLKTYAQALGAAFQKVNFLRDLKEDCESLNRTYFPGFDFHCFDSETKRMLEAGILKDFQQAREGIRHLPIKARFGVYVAYRYYYSLFKKICGMEPAAILNHRVRIPNSHKLAIRLKAGVRYHFNQI